MKTVVLTAALAVGAQDASATQSTSRHQIPNMNGDYVATTCVDGDCSDVKFPTNYMDYPGGVESRSLSPVGLRARALRLSLSSGMSHRLRRLPRPDHVDILRSMVGIVEQRSAEGPG